MNDPILNGELTPISFPHGSTSDITTDRSLTVRPLAPSSKAPFVSSLTDKNRVAWMAKFLMRVVLL